MTALDAAIAAHMAHPAGSLADGLTDSLCEQAHVAWPPTVQLCSSLQPQPQPREPICDFQPTMHMPDTEADSDALHAAVEAATARAAQRYYVLGARAGRLAGFAWGLALGCALMAGAMRLGLVLGGAG